MLRRGAMRLLAVAGAALAGAAGAAVPSLDSLASKVLEVGPGVPGVQRDCPSIGTPAGSVGSCVPLACSNLASFNSWTSASFLQGFCGAELLVDGHGVDARAHQWRAYEVQRFGVPTRGVRASSAMRLTDNGHGLSVLLLNISLSAEPGSSHNVTLAMSPEARQMTTMPWNIQWMPGEWEYSWRNFKSFSGVWNSSMLLVKDTNSSGWTSSGFVLPANSSATFHGRGSLSVQVGGGDSWIAVAVAMGGSAHHVALAAGLQSGGFAEAWAASKADWEARWREAFDAEGERYSGNFPVLETEHPDDPLLKVYYMSCLTVLACERTNLPAVAPRVYLTAFGSMQPFFGDHFHFGGAAAFFWDQSLYTQLQSLLDPVWMKQYLVTSLEGGKFTTQLYEDLLSKRSEGGYWYAFNTVSVFWMLEGYLAATNDTDFLYHTPIANRSVSEWLETLATNWTDPMWGADSPLHKHLADYGDNKNRFLECIPTYVHTPAALQAQNAWMMRVVANIRESEGNTTAAARLRGLADLVSGAVRSQLYVGGRHGGYFGTIYPNGTRVSVRTCLDFMYVGHALAEDLNATQRSEMTAFFNRELRSPHWMRALSRSDPITADSLTRRDDHGYTGAYSAWPALSAQALALLDDSSVDVALDYLRDTALETVNGPYGQAEWLDPPEAPFKDTYSWTRFNANCGGAFAEVVLRRVFGFAPSVGRPLALWRPAASRSLRGRLSGLRLPNGTLAAICSSPSGVAFCTDADDSKDLLL